MSCKAEQLLKLVNESEFATKPGLNGRHRDDVTALTEGLKELTGDSVDEDLVGTKKADTTQVNAVIPEVSNEYSGYSKKEIKTTITKLNKDLREIKGNERLVDYLANYGGMDLSNGVETSAFSGPVSIKAFMDSMPTGIPVSNKGSVRTGKAFYVSEQVGSRSWDDLAEIWPHDSASELEEEILTRLWDRPNSMLDIANDAEIDSLDVQLTEAIEYSESLGSAKDKSPSTKKVEASESTEGVQQTIDGLDKVLGIDDSYTLGSDLEFLADMNDADLLLLDLHNNPDGVMDLARNIDGLDNKHGAKNTNSEYLLSLIDSMVGTLKNVSPLINTAINRDSAVNQGRITGLAGKTMDLELAIGPQNSNRTGLEVYAEELVHAITAFGLKYDDPKMRSSITEIEEIREAFFDNVSTEDLAAMMPDQDTAMKEASDLMEYISGGENSTKEFIAKAVSNPYIMQSLRETITKKGDYTGESLAARFVRWMQKMFRNLRGVISKEPKTNDLERMMYFVARMGDVNAKALDTKKQGVLKTIADFINIKVDKRASNYFNSLRAKSNGFKVPKIDMDASKFDIALYYAKMIPFSLINDKARDLMRTHLSVLGAKPWGTIQMTVDDILDQDEMSDRLEQIGMGSKDADRISALTENSIVKELNSGFGRTLTSREQRGLLQVMKVDAVALDGLVGNGVSVDSLFDGDENTLDKQIDLIEKRLEADYSTDANYFKTMAKLLGRYLSTGETSKVLLKNAHSIANKTNMGGYSSEASKELVSEIDTLVSLKAIKAIPKHLRAASKEFLVDEANETGLASIVKYMSHNKEVSQKDLFGGSGEAHLYTKGYLSDVYNMDEEVLIRPVTETEKLAKEGYKLQTVMDHDYLLRGDNVQFGLFTSDVIIKNRLHSAGFKYNSLKHRGTSISDQYMMSGEDTTGALASRDISREVLEATKILKKIANGTYEESVNDKGMSPILDPTGKVVDFSYEMTHYNKERHLGLKTDPVERLAKTARSIVDKVETEKHNSILVKEIVAEMKRNTEEADLLNAKGESVISKVNGKRYRLINSESTGSDFRELWYALPKSVRREFRGEKDRDGNAITKEGMYIREDHIRGVLGFKEVGIANNRVAKRLKPENRLKLQIAEEVWKNVVSISKVGIVIKMPFVLISNIVSNFAIVVSYLENPAEVARLQMQGVSEINKYTLLHKEALELEARISANVATASDKRKLERANKRMKDSPMKPLVDAGFFTQILEETELQEHRAKIVEKWGDEKMKNMPGFIKSGVSWAFLTDRNAYHKFMYTSTQYSDLAARYAQYQLMKRKGVPENDIQKSLRNAFINYNKPNSPLVEWANQVGLVMFTKYYIRIQRFLLTFGRDNPFKSILLLFADEVLQDPPTVTDSNILEHGVLRLLKSPIEIASTAITPGMGLAVDDITN